MVENVKLVQIRRLSAGTQNAGATSGEVEGNDAANTAVSLARRLEIRRSRDTGLVGELNSIKAGSRHKCDREMFWSTLLAEMPSDKFSGVEIWEKVLMHCLFEDRLVLSSSGSMSYILKFNMTDLRP